MTRVEHEYEKRRMTALGYVRRRHYWDDKPIWRWVRADGKPGMSDLAWCRGCERARPRAEHRGHYRTSTNLCAECRDKRPSTRIAMGSKLRFQILHRDNFTCRYCGRQAPDVALHVDHVIPVSQGGLTEPENLVAACEECNFGKKDALLTGPAPAKKAGK